MCVCVTMGACRGQKVAADALKLEPQGLGSHREWELGIKLWAPAETASVSLDVRSKKTL